MNNKELRAAIIAKNRVNTYIKTVAPSIFAVLKQFEGKKIILATGELSAKVREALNPFLGNKENGIQVWKSSSGYSFSLNFKSSEHYSEFSVVYQESSVYFADLDNGILTKFYDFEPNYYRSDYNLDEILLIQKELEEAEAKVSEIQSRLPAFARR